jgi:hypothetical protein
MLMAMLAIAGCRGPATTAAATASPTGASAPAAALPPLPWPKVPCRRNVEAFLAVGGMRLADLADVQVREDRLAGSQPGEAVSHWHVSGRPPSCGTGRLDLVVLPDCGIDEWATSGGCRLPAYEPSS